MYGVTSHENNLNRSIKNMKFEANFNISLPATKSRVYPGIDVGDEVRTMREIIYFEHPHPKAVISLHKKGI